VSVNPSNQAKVEHPPLQMPFAAPQAPQVAFPSAEGWGSKPPSDPVQQANMQAAIPVSWPSPSPISYPTDNLPHRPVSPPAHQSYSPIPGNSKTIRLGLSISGLCIIAGSFLLIFVYLVGQGGLLGDETTTLSNTQQSNTAGLSQTAAVAQTPTSTSPPITPTPTFPAQNLLSTSMLSNDFNNTQPLTDFKVNQKIYAILSFRAGRDVHTVCLNWYLNNQSVNMYSSEVNPTSNYKYYYWTTMQAAGNGHVDISLTSAMSCTNATLAQKLSFTVSA
jgi:hypothetical protein